MPDGKARFRPVTPPARTLPDGTFLLATRRGKQFNSMVQPLTGAARDSVLISDEDLQRLGWSSGTRARLRSQNGVFEGTLIARHNTGLGESITVRKVSFGQGVERIFPLSARVIDKIDVVRTGKVRRAKLYYLRALKGKAARLKERE